VDSSTEQALTGGNVAAAVTGVGFSGAPRTLGRDQRGRHVVEFVPGTMADTLPPASPDELRRVGRLIREFHDTVESFQPPADAQWAVAIEPDRRDLICHHDLAPWTGHDCVPSPTATTSLSSSDQISPRWARLFAEGHGDHWGPATCSPSSSWFRFRA